MFSSHSWWKWIFVYAAKKNAMRYKYVDDKTCSFELLTLQDKGSVQK